MSTPSFTTAELTDFLDRRCAAPGIRKDVLANAAKYAAKGKFGLEVAQKIFGSFSVVADDFARNARSEPYKVPEYRSVKIPKQEKTRPGASR